MNVFPRLIGIYLSGGNSSGVILHKTWLKEQYDTLTWCKYHYENGNRQNVTVKFATNEIYDFPNHPGYFCCLCDFFSFVSFAYRHLGHCNSSFWPNSCIVRAGLMCPAKKTTGRKREVDFHRTDVVLQNYLHIYSCIIIMSL